MLVMKEASTSYNNYVTEWSAKKVIGEMVVQSNSFRFDSGRYWDVDHNPAYTLGEMDRGIPRVSCNQYQIVTCKYWLCQPRKVQNARRGTRGMPTTRATAFTVGMTVFTSQYHTPQERRLLDPALRCKTLKGMISKWPIPKIR